jgi:hypothetical protein
LVIHGDHESKMNYHERKVTSLKTNEWKNNSKRRIL